MSAPNSSPNSSNSPQSMKAQGGGLNFKVIVYAFAGFILLALIAALLFLRKDAGKVEPHGPNPNPNALSAPPVRGESDVSLG